MMLPKKYLDDILIRMAHHSTAIEGNTLTQYETKSILLDGVIPKVMDEREFYEVKNYKKYIDFLMDNYHRDISMDIIKDTHSFLLRDINDDAGMFKKIHNIILGADFIPTEPYLVIEELKNWCDTLEYRLDISDTIEEKIEVIMDQHLRFERIHPFSDGNGRTGRALIVHSCLQQGIAPIIINKEDRQEYMNLLSNKDVKGLATLGVDLYTLEKNRLEIINQSELKERINPVTKSKENKRGMSL